ncbi:hypothetical protein [Ruminiclostridium cellobioparum]|nr:hypothetical protein [Ruminiclostridium cellobioparum]
MKEVTFDKNGISKNLFVTEEEGKMSVVQFTRDEMGGITGKVIQIQK